MLGLEHWDEGCGHERRHRVLTSHSAILLANRRTIRSFSARKDKNRARVARRIELVRIGERLRF